MTQRHCHHERQHYPPVPSQSLRRVADNTMSVLLFWLILSSLVAGRTYYDVIDYCYDDV